MQLVRQMVLEGVILSAGAGAVALLLTSLTAKTFARFIPANSNPIALNGTVDQNVVIGIVVLAALTSVLSGVLPALRSSHVPASEALKDESPSISGGSHNRRLLSGLVVAQIALSLALLVISGLFLQTLRNLSAGDPGIRAGSCVDGDGGTEYRRILERRGGCDLPQDSRSGIGIADRNGCVDDRLDPDEPEPEDG